MSIFKDKTLLITGGTGSGGAAGEEDRGDRGADCRTQRTKVHIDCRPVVIWKDDVLPQAVRPASGQRAGSPPNRGGQLFCGTGSQSKG